MAIDTLAIWQRGQRWMPWRLHNTAGEEGRITREPGAAECGVRADAGAQHGGMRAHLHARLSVVRQMPSAVAASLSLSPN
jgi:hypothetical protein